MHLHYASNLETGAENRLERLREEAAKLPAPVLQPRAFFLADSGVITLVFDGFTGSLIKLKEKLSAIWPDLVPELRGSKWPKSTLAVRTSPRSLSLDESQQLLGLCAAASRDLSGHAGTIHFPEARFVFYSDRALRRRFMDERISFNPSLEPDCVADASNSIYVEELLSRSGEERLSPVMGECHDLDHYTRTVSEATLILELEGWTHPSLTELTRRVDDLFPGRYEWFEPGIRHVTIRNMGSLARSNT
jgi:hypothetical protein